MPIELAPSETSMWAKPVRSTAPKPSDEEINSKYSSRELRIVTESNREQLQHQMELGHYSVVLNVSEVHYEGYVVIGTPSVGIRVAVGDEVIVFGKSACHRATLQSVQLDGHAVQDATGNGKTEVGLRLSRRAPHGAELRSLRIPAEAPQEMQLKLEDAMPAIADAADTDLAEVAEPESVETEGEANDQEGSA